jgi:signal transduction histidine kinase
MKQRAGSKGFWTPMTIVGIYALAGALWILFSDKAVSVLVPSPSETVNRLQTYKGWFYVAVMAVLLYALIKRMLFDRKRVEMELLEAEKQLQQIQKLEALGALAGGIAHNFNNILSAVIGYAELAKEEIPPENQAHADLSQVLSASFRAKELVKRVLDFSRETVQERIPLSLESVVTDALSLLRATLPASIDIREKITPSGMILGDKVQLQQVVMNLCTHGFHAMKEKGGILEVSIAPVIIDPETLGRHPELSSGEHVLLSVKDTGPGISPELLERIFHPPSPSDQTGLGLSVMYGIVRNHGGCVFAQSKVGQGTLFDVYFPKLASEDPRTPPFSSEETHRKEQCPC